MKQKVRKIFITDILRSISLSTATELTTLSVQCSRSLGVSEQFVDCPFPIVQDAILEGNEYLVVVVTVIDDAGNDINLDRNCAVGRILSNLAESKI